MAFTQVPVSGSISLPNGTPAAGAIVTFTLSRPITDGQTLLSAQPVAVVADDMGVVFITLDANDDPSTTPAGTFYAVVINSAPWLTIDTFNLTVAAADASAGLELFGGSPLTPILTALDGGTPSSVLTDTYDGGSPSSTFTLVIDGGTP